MADRRLQVFHTVARLLSFTKAAESLHMTQPAVTFQVRQLEEYFNTRLFDRTHNRISLTDAGRRVYEYADRILSLYGEMENSVRDITGEVGGVLMLGASTTIAEYMLPTLLGEFKARYPEVIIRLQMGNTDNIVTMVENNTVDLGVVEAPVHNKNLAVDMCCTDKMVLIVPPGSRSTWSWNWAAPSRSRARWKAAWGSRWCRAPPWSRRSSSAPWWRSTSILP
jgi:DNA-binding transcriptional LysR family regulator